jgi:cupin fold WbuC family metalloprotein
VFDEAGQITDARRMDAGGDCWGYDVPPGVWHSIVCLSPGTVFAEAKAGPYTPLVAAEWAAWAPEEGSPEAPDYRAALQARF